MKPTIGCVVLYFPSADDFRVFGSTASPVPATIVRVWSDHCVNLKVHTDAALDAWRTSIEDHEGMSPRWAWPKREE